MPSPLTALSPLDGRYASSADPLRPYFSEHALIRTRVKVELAWLRALAAERGIRELKPFSAATTAALRRLVTNFSERDGEHIKNIEAQTNHDVKAIEYWLRGRLGNDPAVQRALEFIHFACTSEDINNLSYALMFAESRAAVMLPRLDELIAALVAMAHRHARLPMLSRTHGQPASPTTLGKEIANFAHRVRGGPSPPSASSARSTARSATTTRTRSPIPASTGSASAGASSSDSGSSSILTPSRSSRTTRLRSCSTPMRAPTPYCSTSIATSGAT
jgi:Lyase